MIKRVKYICDMCLDTCILEVEVGSLPPTRCPYPGEHPLPVWELMDEED